MKPVLFVEATIIFIYFPRDTNWFMVYWHNMYRGVLKTTSNFYLSFLPLSLFFDYCSIAGPEVTLLHKIRRGVLDG